MLIFGWTGQLTRWPCHSLSHWETFDFWQLQWLQWLQCLQWDYNNYNDYNDYNNYNDYRDRDIESDLVNWWFSDTIDYYSQITKVESWHWLHCFFVEILRTLLIYNDTNERIQAKCVKKFEDLKRTPLRFISPILPRVVIPLQRKILVWRLNRLQEASFKRLVGNLIGC